MWPGPEEGRGAAQEASSSSTPPPHTPSPAPRTWEQTKGNPGKEESEGGGEREETREEEIIDCP